MMTKTRTKSSTKIALATAVVLIAAGIAAYAMATLSSSSTRGYQNFYTQCHDGSTYRDDGERAVMNYAGGDTLYAGSAGCRTPEYWQDVAQRFCAGTASSAYGKVGVNTVKVKDRCDITDRYGYGYSSPGTYLPYGYGGMSTDEKAQTIEKQEKKSQSFTKKVKSYFKKF